MLIRRGGGHKDRFFVCWYLEAVFRAFFFLNTYLALAVLSLLLPKTKEKIKYMQGKTLVHKMWIKVMFLYPSLS